LAANNGETNVGGKILFRGNCRSGFELTQPGGSESLAAAIPVTVAIAAVAQVTFIAGGFALYLLYHADKTAHIGMKVVFTNSQLACQPDHVVFFHVSVFLFIGYLPWVSTIPEAVISVKS